MKLFFTRHGESHANVKQIFWNQPEKFGLTEIGISQSQALADNLAGIAFAALYCSPVLRAMQTARIVGERLVLAPEVNDGLSEWNVGIIEGQKYTPETEALYQQVIKQWLINDNHSARIEGGENFTEIIDRFMPFIDRLEKKYSGTDSNLLLISHGGMLTCMLPLLLINIDNAFSLAKGMPYTTPIVAEEQNGRWVCLRWGELVC